MSTAGAKATIIHSCAQCVRERHILLQRDETKCYLHTRAPNPDTVPAVTQRCSEAKYLCTSKSHRR